MSRDRRGNGVQVVGGSNPPCPTRLNPQNDLAVPHPPTKTRLSAQVSNRAPNLRREEDRFAPFLQRRSAGWSPCIPAGAWT